MAQDGTLQVPPHPMTDLWSTLMALAMETATEGQLVEWVCIGETIILSKIAYNMCSHVKASN